MTISMESKICIDWPISGHFEFKSIKGKVMSEFERIIDDSMMHDDYIPGFDDGEGWDPIMGDADEWIDTDDAWLDDFQGEEEFA